MKMLRNQFYRDTIPRYLEKLDATETGSGIASKTGSLNAVRADVAIVGGQDGADGAFDLYLRECGHGAGRRRTRAR